MHYSLEYVLFLYFPQEEIEGEVKIMHISVYKVAISHFAQKNKI